MIGWSDLVAFVVANASVFRILVILIGAAMVRIIVVSAANRIIERVVAGATVISSRKSAATDAAHARLAQRTRTLASVLRSFANWAIGLIALVLVLGELGFNVTAIVASLGILGAGVALGAQDIIRDIFNGIFLVFEDQIGVGDTVDLGDVKGVVESVTIRILKIRDAKGVLWFVRNGQIQRVGNSSHKP